MRRLRHVLVSAVILIVASGCSERSSVLDPKSIPSVLASLAATPGGDRLYFLGDRFGKLPLAATPGGDGQVVFIYGSCTNSGIGDTGCSPPVAVMNQSTTYPWDSVQGCSRLETRRGVPTVSFGGGITLFTGRPVTMISITARDEAEELRAVAALRPITGDTAIIDLPLPAASDLAGIAKACGAKPAQQGPTPGAAPS